MARVARAGGGDGTRDARRGLRKGRHQPAAARREGRVGGDQRIARLLPRDSRCDERGDVLPDLRQRVLALLRRQGRYRRAKPRRLPRPASCRTSRKRSRRSTRAAMRRRLRASAALLAHRGTPLPLSWFETKKELAQDYREFLPDLPPDAMAAPTRRAGHHRPLRARAGDWKRSRRSLADRADRERLLELASRLLADKRIQAAKPTAEQIAMFEALKRVLGARCGGRDAALRNRRADARAHSRAARDETLERGSRCHARTISTSGCSTSARRCRPRRRRSHTLATRARSRARSTRPRSG